MNRDMENEKLLRRTYTSICRLRDAQNLDTIKGVAIAEALQEIVASIDNALSQQTEPKCCAPTEAELQMLNNGDYTAEELWGGPAPTCPKCAEPVEPAPAQDECEARDWEMKAQGIESVIHYVVSKRDQDLLRRHADDKRAEGKRLAAPVAQTDQTELVEAHRKHAAALISSRIPLVEALLRIANLPIDRCSTDNDYRLSGAKAIAQAALEKPAKESGHD
jgi:hypothetical protein